MQRESPANNGYLRTLAPQPPANDSGHLPQTSGRGKGGRHAGVLKRPKEPCFLQERTRRKGDNDNDDERL